MRAAEWQHAQLSDQRLLSLIRRGEISAAGHQKNQIYGRLDCLSGKRMLRKNRVFFTSVEQAINLGYRPCAHCLFGEYRLYKALNL